MLVYCAIAVLGAPLDPEAAPFVPQRVLAARGEICKALVAKLPEWMTEEIDTEEDATANAFVYPGLFSKDKTPAKYEAKCVAAATACNLPDLDAAAVGEVVTEVNGVTPKWFIEDELAEDASAQDRALHCVSTRVWSLLDKAQLCAVQALSICYEGDAPDDLVELRIACPDKTPENIGTSELLQGMVAACMEADCEVPDSGIDRQAHDVPVVACLYNAARDGADIYGDRVDLSDPYGDGGEREHRGLVETEFAAQAVGAAGDTKDLQDVGTVRQHALTRVETEAVGSTTPTPQPEAPGAAVDTKDLQDLRTVRQQTK